MNIENQTEVKVLATILFQEHKSLMLSTDVVSKITKRSKVSLQRDRAEARGIPCSKLGKRSGSDRVLYSIFDISTYIVSRKMKVLS